MIVIVPVVLLILAGVWYFGMRGPSTPADSLGTQSNNSTSTPPNNFGTPDTTYTSPSPQTQPQATTPPPTNLQQQAITQANQKIMSATLHTNMGDVTIEFDPSIAPTAVANFIKLASTGFYDGTKFHRVIKGFMDQGGDPLSKDDSKVALWGTGGPGYKFNDEITAQSRNTSGTIAMANSGPNTNGSQFFINAVDNNFLDGKYTVFGHVTAGMDVVLAINNTPTGAGDRPTTPVVINSVTLK